MVTVAYTVLGYMAGINLKTPIIKRVRLECKMDMNSLEIQVVKLDAGSFARKCGKKRIIQARRFVSTQLRKEALRKLFSHKKETCD